MSWHIPHLETYAQPSPNDVLLVVFLQRLPKGTRQKIVGNLANVNADWASSFDPSGIMSRRRMLRAIPWIRDSWPTSETILEALSARRSEYQSFILVDSLWEASTVVAAHWTANGDGMSKLDAVRVSMGMANVLLTLLDNGQISDFPQALGETWCEENKIDLYADGPPQNPETKELLSYDQPPFLPSDLRLDRSRLEIVSLRVLSQEQIEDLRSDILRTSDKVKMVPSVVIHNWQGPSPTRAELRQLYDRMSKNSTMDDRSSLAWFVDNIIEGDGHAPRVIALAPDHRNENSHILNRPKVSLFPCHRADVLPLYYDCVASDACYDKADEHGENSEREDVVAIRNPIDFGDGSSCSCPVFYLHPFNSDQERAMRNALNNEDEKFTQNESKSYAYCGYLFPPESGTHTIEDLFILFQKCDPFSSSFDATYSDMRFNSYPTTFVAVGMECLDVETPKVGMAHVNFSWFEPPDDGATHYTGWRYGTTNPSMAWTSFLNLWIGNMDSSELFDDNTIKYLNDLTEHEEWMENGETDA